MRCSSVLITSAFDMYVQANPKMEDKSLNAAEWNVVKELLSLLKPLEKVTTFLSKTTLSNSFSHITYILSSSEGKVVGSLQNRALSYFCDFISDN